MPPSPSKHTNRTPFIIPPKIRHGGRGSQTTAMSSTAARLEKQNTDLQAEVCGGQQPGDRERRATPEHPWNWRSNILVRWFDPVKQNTQNHCGQVLFFNDPPKISSDTIFFLAHSHQFRQYFFLFSNLQCFLNLHIGFGFRFNITNRWYKNQPDSE